MARKSERNMLVGKWRETHWAWDKQRGIWPRKETTERILMGGKNGIRDSCSTTDIINGLSSGLAGLNAKNWFNSKKVSKYISLEKLLLSTSDGSAQCTQSRTVDKTLHEFALPTSIKRGTPTSIKRGRTRRRQGGALRLLHTFPLYSPAPRPSSWSPSCRYYDIKEGLHAKDIVYKYFVFLAVHNSSIGDLVTHWLTDWLTDSG